jgi:hypothetical protein
VELRGFEPLPSLTWRTKSAYGLRPNGSLFEGKTRGFTLNVAFGDCSLFLTDDQRGSFSPAGVIGRPLGQGFESKTTKGFLAHLKW